MANYDDDHNRDEHNPYSYTEDDHLESQGNYIDEPPRTSMLAVASLLSSVIFCCPLTTILAIILGIGALLSIKANPAQRTGKGLAITGIVLGTLFTIGLAVLIPYGIAMSRKADLNMRTQPPAAMQAGFAGDIAGFKKVAQSGLASATDAEIAAFLAELESRYGKFKGMTYDHNEFLQNPLSWEDMSQPMQEYPFLIEFEDATVAAKVGITHIGAEGQYLRGEINIVRYHIIDPERGDIIFPTSRYLPSQSNNDENNEVSDNDANSDHE